MAIKGKKKTKSGKRPRATAPKREVIVPKVPLVQRTGFLIAIATVISLLLGLGLGYGFGHQATQVESEAQKAIETKAAQTFRDQIDAQLPTVGLPTTTGFDPFNTLPGAITSIEQGVNTNEAIKAAKKVEADAKTVIIAWKAIDASTITKGLAQPIIDDFEGSQVSLTESVGLFQEAAALTLLAAKADGAQRAKLASAARDLNSSASTIFGHGYQRFMSTLINAHVTLNQTEIEMPAPGEMPGLPGQADLPGMPAAPGQGLPGQPVPGQPVPGQPVPGQPVAPAPQPGQ